MPGYVVLDAAVRTSGLRFIDHGETRLSIIGRNILNLQRSEPGFTGFDIPVMGRTVLIELRQFF